jgi:molybdopterin-containing oxidoreductase family membrane subunit
LDHSWANFNSPLLWDAAISTHSVSLVFGDTRLPPDFAMISDRAKNLSKENIFIIKFWMVYRAKDWQRFEEVSLVLAGLATFSNSVHTIVSMTLLLYQPRLASIFPPYFVGAGNFLWI